MTKFQLIQALMNGTYIAIKGTFETFIFSGGITAMELESGGEKRNCWNVTGFCKVKNDRVCANG